MKQFSLFFLLAALLLALHPATAQTCPQNLTISATVSSQTGTSATWTAPATGGPYRIRITAKGARGGEGYNNGQNVGGYGAMIMGEFSVTAGQVLELTAGAPGGNSIVGSAGGGGGGSGVQIQNGALLLVAGGGGGGGSSGSGGNGGGGSSGPIGTSAIGGGGGGGGTGGGGSGSVTTGGGGGGGGGIGGGGGGGNGGGGIGGGGGGGYGGGNGNGGFGGGGGGGSINYGTNQTNTAADNNGGGQVIIECLGTAAAFAPTFSVAQPTCGRPGSLTIDLAGDFNNSTNSVEYAIVSGGSFSGTPSFTTITAEPLAVTSGTGTTDVTYTVRTRLIYNPSIYTDYTYTFATLVTNVLTWTGSTSREWNTASNWCPARIPLTTDDVVIPNIPTNQPVLSTAAVANSVEVQGGASLSVTNAGSLTLNGSKSVSGFITAFYNGGTVVSGGQLVIGNTASVGNYGLYNAASFSNVTGGQISIDNASIYGLASTGSFVNSSRITIGAIASVGSSGLYNTGSFSNVSGGQISIDRAANYGLYNQSGRFVNSSSITIGAIAGVGSFALYNYASFSNESGGQISIDRATNTGLYNDGGSFVNSATITIGAIASVGSRGLVNQASFSNEGCSALLRVVSNAVITDQSGGSLSNTGTIIENASGTSNIASNAGIVQNLNGGTFTITTNTGVLTTTPGLLWTGCTDRDWNTPTNWSAGRVPLSTDDVTIPSGPANQPVLSTTAVAKSVEVQGGASLSVTSAGSLTLNGSKTVAGLTTAFYNGGTVVSGGQLVIGNTASVGFFGLSNLGSFSNVAGGQISIDNARSIGLYNVSGSFVNSSRITIGAIASVGQYGLVNYASFRNVSGGQISIDNASNTGLYNSSGSFVNSSRITIGAIASVGQYGLFNGGSFSNVAGGQISIDNASQIGLWNGSGSFVNSSTLTIGAIVSAGPIGLRNEASFRNEGCSALLRVMSDAIITDQNSGSFTNTGTIIENASGTSNIASNAGIVVNNNGGTFTTGSGPNQPLSLSVTNPTTCNPANGSLTIAGVQANTTFALSYTVGGTTATVSPVSDGSGQFTVGGLGGGDYTLTLSGACVPVPLSLSATLTNPASPTISTQPVAGSAVCVGGAVTVSVSATGPGPLSYAWYKDGSLLSPAQSTATLSLTNVQASDAGSYSVVVTGSCNSVTSTAFSLTVNALPTNASLTSGTLTCAQTSVTLTATATEATSYTLSDGQSNKTGLFAVSTPGNYTVTVSNASGCTATATASVESNTTAPTASILPTSATLTCASPAVSLTASGMGSYRWDDNTTNAVRSVSTSGVYSVTVTATNGCTATATASVVSNTAAPTASILPMSATLTCASPAVSLTASGTGSYVWDDNSTNAVRSVSAPGPYSVTVTGANGCTAMASVTIFQNITPPTASILPISATLTCASPTVSLTASGTGSYRWDDNSTNAVRSVSTPGPYSVTVTGANGCTATAGVTIFQNITPPTASILPISATLTCASPAVSLTASGTGSYRWDDNSTNAVRSVSAPGPYSVTVTGANGCTATASVTIFQNITPPTVSILPISATLTCASPAVSLTASGGGSYRWDNNSTNAVRSVSAPGPYSVTVTGANGCTATAGVTIFQNITPPTASLMASSLTFCSGSAVTLTAGSGTGYAFSGPGLSQSGASTTATASQGGSYSVTVTGANGCTATASVSLTANALPPAPTLTSVSRTVTASPVPLPLSPFVSAAGVLSFSGVSGLLSPAQADISSGGVLSFSVSQTDGKGCVSAATPFSITVVVLPPVSQTVCRSSVVVLSVGLAGSRYEWYKNGQSAPFRLTEIASIQRGTSTSSLTLVSVQTTASYYCKIFAANGSFSFVGPFAVVVNYGCVAPGGRVATESVADDRLNVVLAPNPLADGQLRAVVGGASGQALSASLLDLRGVVVRWQEWAVAGEQHLIEWDVRDRASGVYLLRVQANGQSQTVKVVNP